jgi:hypothetical protein
MRNRGQTALEYLVTYGWAILGLVIIAGVLWYFGVFTPGRFAPTEQTTGFSVVLVLGHKVTASNGQLTLTLANQASETVNVTSVQAGTGAASSPALSLAPGGQGTVSAVATGIATGSTGDAYNTNVTITYTLTRSGISGRVSAGTISGRMS